MWYLWWWYDAMVLASDWPWCVCIIMRLWSVHQCWYLWWWHDMISMVMMWCLWCWQVTDQGVCALSRGCDQSTTVDVYGDDMISMVMIWCLWCFQVTDDGVCALSRGCHQLTTVILSGIHRLTDRSIISLANGCPHITELYVSGCNMITRAAIRYLVVCIISPLISHTFYHRRHFRGHSYPHFLEWGYRAPTFYELSQVWND